MIIISVERSCSLLSIILKKNLYKIWSLKYKSKYQPPYLFVVNVAFLQGASTTKIEPCFTPYTLKSQRHLSEISFNITKRSLFVVLGLLDF